MQKQAAHNDQDCEPPVGIGSSWNVILIGELSRRICSGSLEFIEILRNIHLAIRALCLSSNRKPPKDVNA